MSTRAQKLKKLGIYEEVMWHERFKEEHQGDFRREQAKLETESLEEVFDRWCRGQNLIGFSVLIIDTLAQLKKVIP